MEQLPTHPADALTARELDIIRLLSEGLSNREIADKLFLSPGTVKWYNKQIYSKLAVNNRVQAINRANELGLLGTDGDSESATPLF